MTARSDATDCGWIAMGLVATAAGASLALAAPSSPNPMALDIKLAPQSEGGRVVSILVRETIATPPIPAGQRFLTMPMLLESIPGTLSDPSTLTATDAFGALPLVMTEDPADPAQVRQERHWAPARATRGAVTITYLATPRVVTAQTPPAPLNDMRTEGHGIYGSTALLLALPDAGWPRRVAVRWSLNGLPAGSRAASSYGEGNTITTMSKDDAQSGYFMAGPLLRLPPAGASRFTVYYLTPPAFDLTSAAAFTAKTYDYAGRFFGDASKPFRVFMRTTDRFQGGGGGGLQSFIFGAVKGQDRDPAEVRHLMAHEAIHNWISSFGDGYAGKWFVEGGTEYYSVVLPHRAGLSTVAEFGTAINDWARDYYTNPRRTMPDAEATKVFLTDPAAQLLPYQRGPLYIAQVDARMRAMSAGHRRVDELVLPMVRAIREGQANEALWAALVAKALGPKGAADFAAFKAGEPLNLPSDLFGPCFRSEPTMWRAFQPGFRIEPDPDGSHRARFIRKGLAASAAGLLDGDRIDDAHVLTEGRKREGQPIMLHIRRGAVPMTLSIAPWGPAVEGLRWVRTIVDDKACAI